jgi:hypothetical protein
VITAAVAARPALRLTQNGETRTRTGDTTIFSQPDGGNEAQALPLIEAAAREGAAGGLRPLATLASYWSAGAASGSLDASITGVDNPLVGETCGRSTAG